MSKPKTPLLAFEAHGTIGDAITYQRTPAGNIARAMPKPTGKPSEAQVWQRFLYQLTIAYWKTLSPAQKAYWRSQAGGEPMSGFNAFMRARLEQLRACPAIFPLDEPAGAIAQDYSGHQNHASVFQAVHSPGYRGKALLFDGVNDYAQTPASPLYVLQNTLALECWIYITQVKTWAQIFGRQHAGVLTCPYGLFYGDPDKYILISDGASFQFATWQGPALNAWHHICGNLTPTHIQLWWDGLLKEEKVRTVNPQAAPAQKLTLGAFSALSAGWFAGKVDVAILWPRHLLPEEIVEHASIPPAL